MTTFYLVRHGEPAWGLADELGLVGAQRDLVLLTQEGVRQSQVTARDPRLRQAETVLSSPYTRALQTATIIAGELRLPLIVEQDLHEWVPDLTFQYSSPDRVRELSEDYERCNGVYPVDGLRLWEPKASVSARVRAVLLRYLGYGYAIVVCHGMVIRTQVDVGDIPFAGIVELSI